MSSTIAFKSKQKSFYAVSQRKRNAQRKFIDDVLLRRDKSGKVLTEEKEILSRWTEYCSELYDYESCGDNAELDCSQPPEEGLQPILREEVEISVASLKEGSLPELIIYHQNLFKLAGRP